MVLPSAVNGGVGSQPPALLLQPPKEQRTLLLNEAKLWSVLPAMTQIMPATRDLVLNSAQQNGLSEEQFLELMRKPASALSDSEKILMENIRNAVPMPDENTVLQKVISANYVDSYFDGSFLEHSPGIKGFFNTAESAVGLNTPQALFGSMRLDYDGSPFSLTDDVVTVIRFTTNDVSDIHIPYGGDMPHPLELEEATEWKWPYTGHGFTAAENGGVLPELYSSGVELKNAKMFEILSDGQEKLIAEYDDVLGRFKPIEE
jgi:hypothetical protein